MRALQRVAELLLALLILFEEWGWEPLQRAMAWLARAPLLRRVEAWIVRLAPGAALAVLLLPSLALVPVKLGALWLLARGQALLGLALIVVAKLVGTAVMARLFTLTRPALLRMPWFAAAYARWTDWKEALLARVRASAAWRAAGELRQRLRGRWDRLRGRRM